MLFNFQKMELCTLFLLYSYLEKVFHVQEYNWNPDNNLKLNRHPDFQIFSMELSESISIDAWFSLSTYCENKSFKKSVW